MRFSIPPLNVRLGFAALLALAALGGIPSTAKAGCIGHVQDVLKGGDILSLADFQGDKKGVPAPPRPHCSGPGCSQAPAFPPLAPSAPPGGDRAELWGCLAIVPFIPGPEPSLERPGSDPARTANNPSRLDRPPRA